MKLERLGSPFAPPSGEGFGAPVNAQGGSVRARGGERLVTSGGRFKLFCARRVLLGIAEGEGYIKWPRGEVPFSAGDAFSAEGEGELDLYGKCVFVWTAETEQGK